MYKPKGTGNYTDEEIQKELEETFRNGQYNQRTTFSWDFCIANRFGIGAVKETFNRTFKEWKDDIIYLTELALVMNAYTWQFYQTRKELSDLYAGYYYQCRDYVYTDGNFTEEETHYYYRCTD